MKCESNVGMIEDIKNITRLVFSERTFYLSAGLLIVLTGLMIRFVYNAQFANNTTPGNIMGIFILYGIGMLAAGLTAAWSIFRLRLQLFEQPSGTYASYVAGLILHSLKSIVVAGPLVLIFGLFMFSGFIMEVQSGGVPQMENPMESMGKISIISFIFSMFLIMWALASYGLVTAQLNSKKSIRNSFRVLARFIKPISILTIIFWGVQIIPSYIFPEQTLQNSFAGHLDQMDPISPNGANQMQISGGQIALVSIIFFAVYAFSFVSNLYIAKLVSNTDLIANKNNTQEDDHSEEGGV